ncbi:HNH endonuclease [Paracoccus sp. ME4]|uniref:HNH endonuclease n=1 Tax=Paracoccus sp. ME4 TaxID=3138066 RepID=UPI00398AEB67
MSREAFGAAVFARDRHRCVACGAQAVDAHHILDRKLYADGGYYLGNGASVCGPCHLEAEKTLISVEALREACGIVNPPLPKGLRDAAINDKWGNEILSDGRRLPGPMIGDDGARKILALAGILWSGCFVDEDGRPTV